MEDLNLHFTGDFHAITSANNLLAALLDNHIQQGNALGIDTSQVVWKRCMDMNDRALRNIVIGLGSKSGRYGERGSFCHYGSVRDYGNSLSCRRLKGFERNVLATIIVAYNFDGDPVTAEELNAVGAMAALLKGCD